MNLYHTDSFDFLDKRTKQILIETRESFVPHTPYLYEKNLLEAVTHGNLELALECLALLESAGKAGTLSKDPLRQSKIIFISHITLVTRAAMDADVPEDLAYAMSDSYIQASEACTSLAQIHTLTERSLRDFVAAVKHQKSSPPYSKATRKAINYINSHLQEKITLNQLAQAAGLSVGRLSHLFKEETGLTPLSYVQKEKMETAKSMLQYSSYRISEISAILGYSSESHFIKIFEKYTGVSPRKYRNQQE